MKKSQMPLKPFSPQQRRELRKLLGRLPVTLDNLGRTEQFTLEYIAFEAMARKIWHYYRCRSKTKPKSKSGIPIVELEKALQHFGVVFEKWKLNLLLNSSLDKRNSKSARNLRNGVLHTWNEKDCKEAADRLDEFIECFTAYRQAVEQAL